MDNLTMDVLAAAREGMSYGMWKASHLHTEGTYEDVEPVKDEELVEIRICAVCGKEFTPARRNSNAKYCSDQCYQFSRSGYMQQYRDNRKTNKQGDMDAS